MLDPFLPFGVRQIASERDAAAAPAERRKSAYLQQKLAIYLAEFRSLAPVVNLQSWDDCMLRQRRWVKQPRVGNNLLQLDEIFLAQFASPKFAKRLHPKKRKIFRSEEHTSELQSHSDLVCRLLLE